MPRHRMQRYRERIRHDGDLVGDGVRDRYEHRVMGRQKFSEAPGGIARQPGVHAGGEPAVQEVVTEAQVARHACGTLRVDPSGPACQPRIQDDPLADLESPGIGAELGHLGDDLVAEHRRIREERVHGIVPVAFPEILEDVLGVGPADTGQARFRHDPVGSLGMRFLELGELHRRRDHSRHERIGRI